MKQPTHGLASLKTLVICLLLALVTACAVYKPELSQGNLLTAEQISKLQVGMPKSQVQLLLGSPLLQDVFHANRWEYIFRQIKGEKTLEQRVFTVEFDAAGKLVKWSGMVSGNAGVLQLNNPLSAAPQRATEPSTVTAAGAASRPTTPAAMLPLAVSQGLNQAATPAQANAAQLPITNPAVVAKNNPQDTIAELSIAIESWRTDWEKADFAAYIAHYRSDFVGTSRSRAAWETDRKRMISGRKIQAITLSQITVQQTSDVAARAYFKQRFEAVNFQESGEKTLLFERVKGQWLIVGETFNKA